MAVLRAECPPVGCRWHTFSETCPVCMHPEFCPTYGHRQPPSPLLYRAGCKCVGFHNLGCSGHPFHPDYNRTGWASPEKLESNQVEGSRRLYVAGVIDLDELERRIEAALLGTLIDGDPDRP